MVQIVKLSEHVYVVLGEKGGKYPFSNCIYIKGSKSCLIDSGAGKICIDLKPEYIINSHWHEDHIGYNHQSSTILAHEDDADAIKSMTEFEKRYSLPNTEIFTAGRTIPSRVDETFGNGDSFEFGRVKVTAIHTPGHSAGHCCFLIGEGNFRGVFLADIDLTRFGPWYGCLDCSVSDFKKSIDSMMKLIESEDIDIAVSGHKPPQEGRDNILSQLRVFGDKLIEREERILRLLKNLELDDLIGRGIFYQKLPEPVEIFSQFERIMIEKHLESLESAGLPRKSPKVSK
jgi:glyoxylase-like metal-dependent hydrolase (beta-lactamase superfamily II)